MNAISYFTVIDYRKWGFDSGIMTLLIVYVKIMTINIAKR